MVSYPSRGKSTKSAIKNPIRRVSVRALEFLDLIVYTFVGLAFFAAAALALGYSVLNAAGAFGLVHPSPTIAQTVLNFVSDLLLVLIIMEVLGTVRSYLEKGDTSVKPFLFIGIISATRGILSIGARLSINLDPANNSNADEFTRSMIELGVNAFIIIALGVTLRVMGKYADNKDDELGDIQRGDGVAGENGATAPDELAPVVAAATTQPRQP